MDMFRKFTIVTAAVIVTGGIPQVSEHVQLTKGDRLPALVKGAACSAPVWPNYDARCLFDMRRPVGEVRTVRVVDLTTREIQPR
jgi:hypothetical protein